MPAIGIGRRLRSWLDSIDSIDSILDEKGQRRYNPHRMPLPLVPLAIGAIFGGAATKKGKGDFQAVKGRKKKDGTTSKPYVRKKKSR